MSSTQDTNQNSRKEIKYLDKPEVVIILATG